MPIPGSFPQAVGFLDESRLLASYTHGRPAIAEREPRDRVRTSIDIAAMAPGTTPVPLGTFPDRSWFFFRWQGSLSNDTLPLGPTGLTAVTRGSWFYTDGIGYEIQRFDRHGQLTASIRVEATPPGSGSRVAEFKRRRMEDAPSGSEALWRTWLDREIPFPPQLPAFDRLLVDQSGRVWVRQTPRMVSEDTYWLVFDPAGRLVAEVPLPPRFDPLHISADAIVGRWRDDLDVHFVRIYEFSDQA